MRLTVAIGRNVEGVPMPEAEWNLFVTELYVNVGGQIEAVEQGSAYTPGWGSEGFYRLWVVDPWKTRDGLTKDLEALARKYRQDAITVTWDGETVFIGGEQGE